MTDSDNRTGDCVTLHLDEEWAELSEGLRERITKGVDRIRSLRAAIGAAARVRYMPPVTVVAAAWTPDGERWVQGVSGVWRDPTALGGHSIGVLVSAGPALCEEDQVVRALLVHEFAHCFSLAKIIVDHNDLGTPLDALQGDSFDHAREHRLQVDPQDWFGREDWDLMQWNDERMKPVSLEVGRLVTTGQLVPEGLPLYEKASFQVPLEWKEHVRDLRVGPKP